MLLLDLFETPIANIHTHGDFSKPGSLRQDDLSLVTQKRQDKIKKVLQKSPIEIDLHILNIAVPVSDRNGNFDINWHINDNKHRIGYLTPEQVAEYWTPISPRPDALNLLMVQNEGDDRLPLTPWIIAHRLSHSFDYAEPLIVDRCFKTFLNCLESVQDDYRRKENRDLKFPELAVIYGTTKACREGLIKNLRTGEWMHDCFAQLCVTGDIRFNKAPEHLYSAESINENFEYLRQKLLKRFKDMLNNSVGKILVF